MVVLGARQRFSWLQQPRKVIGEEGEEHESVNGRRSSLDKKTEAKRNSTIGGVTINNSENNQSANNNTSNRAWPRFFAPKKRNEGGNGVGDWIPSLSGVIKAGDEGVYASALFHQLHQHNPAAHDLTLDALYDLFANQLRNRPLLERTNYPSDISKFLASSKKIQRSRSLRVSREGRRPNISPLNRAPRSSLDLSEVTSSLSRSLSTKKPSPTTPTAKGENGILSIPAAPSSSSPKHELWTHDMQQTIYNDGLANMAISSSELLTLSLLLGTHPISSTSTNEDSPRHSKALRKGAYGISITHTRLQDETHQINLHRHALTIPQRPAQTSITSTLHAKHIAHSCVPLYPPAPPSTQTTPTLLITPVTLSSLLTKSPIASSPSNSSKTSPLLSLPHARPPSFPPYALPTLLHSIAALPFAAPTPGLAPLVAQPLRDAVVLIAGGGRAPGRLLQRLEALVDRVQRFCGQDAGFGEMYEERYGGVAWRERERLGRVGAVSRARKNKNESRNPREEDEEEELVGKTARVTRYVVLLDRLVKMMMLDWGNDTSVSAPPIQPPDINTKTAKVIDATFRDLLQSYTSFTPASTTTTAHSPPTPPSEPHPPQNPNSNPQTRTIPSTSTPTQPLPPSPPPTPTKTTSTPNNTKTNRKPKPKPAAHNSAQSRTQNTLAADMEALLQSPLPFSTAQIARVARCVLFAWAEGGCCLYDLYDL